MTDAKSRDELISRTNKPWTRWWWMGGALTPEAITQSLERFYNAGFGGVEVSPICGPRGYEDRFTDFLSPRWMELFAHTLREAERLDMGVDLIAGTGWPFGGPWVSDTDSAMQMWVETLPAGVTTSQRKSGAKFVAAQTAGNKHYALFFAPTGQQVKRAAPGGDGNVLDHFDKAAVQRYFAAFDKAFAELPNDLRPRCFFNDSWEVFGANATETLFAEFAKRRGYDLREQLPALAGDGDKDTILRVRSDYRETIHDLVLDSFLTSFAEWARTGHGAKIRNQAHGSPGNLLDLYAIADIPETEVFGPARLDLGGLAKYRSLPPDFGSEEEPLVCRMASSAAHVAGRPLCSSESFTWLGEHGHVPLEHMKAEADTLFTLGFNHLFFHGTPFSPEDIPFPGWMFYATTHVAPTNPLWRDLPALNKYIANCQALLQSGKPGNDILLYFPFYDLIAGEAGTHDLLQFLTVGRTATWLRANLPEFTEAANHLAKSGWTFDMVSDRQLQEIITVNTTGDLLAQESSHDSLHVISRRRVPRESPYKALLIVGCRRMPPETLERIAALAEGGATVLFADDLLSDVPGLARRDERLEQLQSTQEALAKTASTTYGKFSDSLLESVEIERETVTDLGIEFIRRRTHDGWVYFLSNPGTKDIAGWIPLVYLHGNIVIADPMRGIAGSVTTREGALGHREIYLELPAGASLFVETGMPENGIGSWKYRIAINKPIVLTGEWQVEFTEGGAVLPAARTVSALSDWTTWEAEDAELLRDFSGTARYTLRFDAPDIAADMWTLALGKVCHSAQVTVNDAVLGTMVARPWQVIVPAKLLKPTGNTLTITVTNLMANRLAALERAKGAEWRPFLMVNIHYKPFDAANWELVPSGLLGPVTLVPERFVTPE